jgi:hypothetical protein
MFLNSKDAKFGGGLSTSSLYAVIEVFVLIVVLFLVVANLFPTLSDAGDSLNDSGIPLGSFYVSGGLVMILISIAIFLVVLGAVMPKGKK